MPHSMVVPSLRVWEMKWLFFLKITVVVFEENMLRNRRNTEMKFLECLVAHWRKFEKRPSHLDR